MPGSVNARTTRPARRWAGQVLGQVAHEVAHRLARLGHQHRGHRRVERHVVASRQHRGVGGVRGAAEEPQQRHVVHARPRRRIQPERLGRPQRQPARPQPVLHRLTGAEIRRQRQRHRQLRQPTRRAIVSHTTTVPARQPPVDGRTRPGSRRPPVDGRAAYRHAGCMPHLDGAARSGTAGIRSR